MYPRLIPSFGHNCGFGSIRWPQLQTAASDPQTNRLNPVLSHDIVVCVKITTRTTKEREKSLTRSANGLRRRPSRLASCGRFAIAEKKPVCALELPGVCCR